MSIISFRCHTTIHLAPLVNQETIHQDMDRGQQLMSRINQGILREIKPKNPLVEWYYWKDKHTVSDVTEHSLFKMAQGMLSPVENDNYRLEEIEEWREGGAVTEDWHEGYGRLRRQIEGKILARCYCGIQQAAEPLYEAGDDRAGG